MSSPTGPYPTENPIATTTSYRSHALFSAGKELLPPTGTDRGCRCRLCKVCISGPIASFLFSPSPESLRPAPRLAFAVAKQRFALCPRLRANFPSSSPSLPFHPRHRPSLISPWHTTPSITTTTTAFSSQQQDIGIPTSIDSSSSSISPSFERLKTQKVKALVHRSKQHRNRSTDNGRPRDSSPNPRSRGGWGDAGGSFRSLNSQELAPDTNFFSVKSFRELGCADYLIQSLQKLSFPRPSNVQAMAFAPVIAGKTCIIADQSGSGKTLAYLAPIIQRLRQEELEGHSKSSPQAPRVVILAPTAELASQVLDNCRSLSRSGVPFKSMVVTGGFRQRTQLETLQQGVDVLIATPGRFLFLMKEGFLHVVLDEVDILFGDEDFEVALQSLINSSPITTQYLFVTATLPRDVYSKLVEIFPDCEMIMGPSMHRISPRLEEIIVDCSGEDGQEKTTDTAFLNKKSALLQLAEERPVPRTIVFCNKIETCRKVENALKRIDRKGAVIQVLPFHAAMTQESRLASMKEFARSPSKQVSQFMVCTDRRVVECKASREIDFWGVEHVILFDFPRDPSEYVRRVGRTARGAKGVGKAFIFVVGKQVSLARKIMERNRKGHPLHDVPSAYV
ncbi:hypothetical protein Ahy_B04g071981 [Arachis hypogaea]|uniref:DEAD-box ATP-dependent RNA helicase n=1 Tax=Arachis hypogaea TaxID=3818 RepID=A0A444ZMC4_ARAHY|nr:hypothetical protein Ahy_B04g071981 [Arachis hypogaea]